MKREFQKGDRIKVIGRFDAINISQIGKTATIGDIDHRRIAIVFDEKFDGGNTADSNCPYGFGYNMWGNSEPHKYIQLIYDDKPNYEIY